MRIALLSARRFHTPPVAHGGTERAVDALARALSAEGVEVVVWAKQGSPVSPDYGHRVYGPDGIEDWDELRGFDVVHNHWFGDDNWGGYRFLDRLLRHHPRVAQTYHGNLPYYIRPYAMLLRWRRRRPFFIVQSSGAYQYARRHRLPNVTRIPNVLPKGTFGADGDGPLLYLGRLEPEKGVLRAIDVAGRTRQPLDIAGPVDPGFFRSEVEPRLTSDIRYLGVVSEEMKDSLLRRARALVFPSQYAEGMPLVVLEAFARGTPVVASNSFPSAQDLVEPGVTGFRCHDAAEMVAAVRDIGKVDRRRCLEWAQARFGAPVVARQHLDVYSTMFQEPANPRA